MDQISSSIHLEKALHRKHYRALGGLGVLTFRTINKKWCTELFTGTQQLFADLFFLLVIFNPPNTPNRENPCAATDRVWCVPQKCSPTQTHLPHLIETRKGEQHGQYRQRENWLENFLEECCVMEPDARAPAGELYQTYREWAQRSGDYVRRDMEFSDAMAGKGFPKKTPAGRKVWIGLRIDHKAVFSA